MESSERRLGCRVVAEMGEGPTRFVSCRRRLSELCVGRWGCPGGSGVVGRCAGRGRGAGLQVSGSCWGWIKYRPVLRFWTHRERIYTLLAEGWSYLEDSWETRRSGEKPVLGQREWAWFGYFKVKVPEVWVVLKMVIGNMSHLGKNSKLKIQVKKFSLPSGSG